MRRDWLGASGWLMRYCNCQGDRVLEGPKIGLPSWRANISNRETSLSANLYSLFGQSPSDDPLKSTPVGPSFRCIIIKVMRKWQIIHQLSSVLCGCIALTCC